MSAIDDMVQWLTAQLDEDERIARKAASLCGCHPAAPVWLFGDESTDGRIVIAGDPHPDVRRKLSRRWSGSYDGLFAAEHIARHDPARVLREVEAKRRILDEHAPEWQTVEWPHDQNGKGEAQVCRRCQNAEHTEWHPAVGEAGVLPEGFVAPYVLAPCVTLRLLALPYAGRPGYRDEWRP